MLDQLLKIELLGYPQVELNGLRIDSFVTKRAEALFYYLATIRRPHSRDKLAALFWPDMIETKGKKNLRTALPVLRKMLGDYLIISRSTIAFDDKRPFTVDIDVLQTAVSTENVEELQTAVDNYKGDFLEGFYVDGSPDFDDWIFAQTEHYRNLLIQGLHLLTAHYLEERQYTDGLITTARLLEIEPWSESGYRQRMLFFAYNKQRSAALQTYADCQRALDKTFGIVPTIETSALYKRIRAEETDGEETAVPLHNLPRAFTPFIGRQSELQALREKILNPLCSLITIMGEGGVGKSRLAMTVAAQLLYDFPDGVWFVPLMGIKASDEAVKNETSLALAVGKALQLQLQPNTPIIEQVIAQLQNKKLLLVLDNMEQLVDGADFIVRLLREVRKIKLIVTSRRRLNLQMESVFRLRGLPVPDKSTDKSDPIAYASVQLFNERAHRAEPDFVVTTANRGAIGDICRLVDGLPLGIELAAALVEQQSCANIAIHIEEGIEILAATMRDLPVHHRTIYALFEYSWQLLTKENQLLLARCSVFAGGFTLGAATAVAVADAVESGLTDLIDQSLLTCGENACTELGRNGRYTMHPLIQQFAARKLNEIGRINEVQGKHSDYYLTAVTQQTNALIKGMKPKALRKLTLDMNNIRRAWYTAVAQRRYAVFAKSTVGISRLFQMGSYLNEAVMLFRHALKQMDDGSNMSKARQRVQANLLAQYALLIMLTGDYHEAGAIAQQAKEQTKDDTVKAYALFVHVHSQLMGGNESAKLEEMIDELLQLSRRQKMPDITVSALRHYAIFIHRAGKPQEALFNFEQAAVICREYGLNHHLGEISSDLATFYNFHNKYEMSRRFFTESLLIQRQLKNSTVESHVLASLTRVSLNLGDHTAAQAYHQELKSLAHDLNLTIIWSMEMFVEMLLRLQLGEFEEACRIGEKNLPMARQLGNYNLPDLYLYIGYAQRRMGQYAKAERAYKESVNIHREDECMEGELEPLAFLAELACCRGDIAQAQRLIDEVLVRLTTVFLQHEAILDLMQLYWICYQVLATLNDPRADGMLKTAYDLLQERVGMIEETAVRQQFLSISTHREIVGVMGEG